MATKKISELATKTFLGTSGAAENSYIMVNYAESANGTPVTVKASIEELGKSIASKLGLVMDAHNYGAKIYTVDQGAYSAVPADGVMGVDGSLSKHITVEGGEVPWILQYDPNEQEYGYFASATTESWQTVNLGGGATMDASTIGAGVDTVDDGGNDINCQWVFVAPSIGLSYIDDSGIVHPFNFADGQYDASTETTYRWVFYNDTDGELVYVNDSGMFQAITQ